MSLFTGSYSQSRSLQNSTSSNLTSFTSLPRCLTWSCSIDFERYKRAADPRLIQNSEVLKLLREQESGVERGGVGGGGQHRSYSEHFLTRKQSFFGQQSTLDTSQGITEDAYCVPPPPPPSSPTEIIISGSCKKSRLLCIDGARVDSLSERLCFSPRGGRKGALAAMALNPPLIERIR